MKLQQTSINSADFSSIYEILDNSKQYEGYIVATCPFHEDTRPSFFVYPDWFKCLACGANGPTSSLLKRLGKIDRVPHPRAKQIVSDNPFTHWLKRQTLRQLLKSAWNVINQNPSMGNYITRDRGIDEFYRMRLGIGYIDDWYTIPILNRNGSIISAVARKGRGNPSQNKYILPNGTNPNILYVPNWKRVRTANYLIVTFGILDAITLAIMGEPAASTITGKRLSKASLVRFRIPILLIPDRHEEQDGLEAAQKLGWRGLSKKICWPAGCNDINDIWMKDRENCKQLIKELTHGLDRSL